MRYDDFKRTFIEKHSILGVIRGLTAGQEFKIDDAVGSATIKKIVTHINNMPVINYTVTWEDGTVQKYGDGPNEIARQIYNKFKARGVPKSREDRINEPRATDGTLRHSNYEEFPRMHDIVLAIKKLNPNGSPTRTTVGNNMVGHATISLEQNTHPFGKKDETFLQYRVYFDDKSNNTSPIWAQYSTNPVVNKQSIRTVASSIYRIFKLKAVPLPQP